MLSADQHRRVRELFEAVVERESAEAYAWIAREAADDPAVQKEVQSLLYHHSKAGEFLQQPAAEAVPDLLQDEPLQAGARVGSYTIVREIGRGGMGRVYLARDEKLNRTVALKALAPQLVRNPAFRERLRREARAAAALTHPGICTVYALEELDGDLYLATELVDGRTLREEIASGQGRSPREVLRTARELASALASAHEHGVVHRDLKPENVMRTRDGRLKILDFGIARIDERGAQTAGAGPGTAPTPLVTEPGVTLGTPAYMAPEQINGETPDARADVFAFGVFMYEYSCGVHPFDGSSGLAIVARILDSEPRPIASRCPQLPVRLAEVIGRCLRKRPDERYATAAAIVDALADAGEPIVAGAHFAWWRIHQLVACGLYVAAAVLAWLIKAWFIETPLTVAAFIALGAGATIGAILRGHLVFTERNNPAYLTRERHRARRPMLLLDGLIGAVLALDALLVSHLRALWAVFALSLGLGIVLAALVLEPATTAAAFGEE
jgi:tRNA A-37 threonylcarbamoyl transferase component Bud32